MKTVVEPQCLLSSIACSARERVRARGRRGIFPLVVCQRPLAGHRRSSQRVRRKAGERRRGVARDLCASVL